MARVFNFSAGPSTLPESVLQKVANELLDYQGSGMSVMEMSHRSKVFTGIIENTEKLLRETMNISDDYHVLFLQGGASTQFAMIPMNLLKNKKIDLLLTGNWANIAYKEAKKFAAVNLIGSSEDKNFTYIPEIKGLDPEADYVHVTSNNTIFGTRLNEYPDTGNVPLVADFSSNILSEPVDVSQFGIIYAGAQKNLGPAGVTLVIIRKDLVEDRTELPTMLKYKTHVDKGSMHNTPPTFGIYVVGEVLQWIKDQGGVDAVYKTNLEKANCLYDYLDSSKMFKGTVEKKDRSLMNIPFVTGNEELDAQFIKEAGVAGFVNLKGYRTVGGMRASIYNAMPVKGVQKLVEFMKEFEAKNS